MVLGPKHGVASQTIGGLVMVVVIVIQVMYFGVWASCRGWAYCGGGHGDF